MSKGRQTEEKNEGQNKNGKVGFPSSICNMQVQSGACVPTAQEFGNVHQQGSLRSLGVKEWNASTSPSV